MGLFLTMESTIIVKLRVQSVIGIIGKLDVISKSMVERE